jgi:hypothetical protein
MTLIYQLRCSDFVEALLKSLPCRPKPGQPDKRANSIRAPSISFFEDLFCILSYLFFTTSLNDAVFTRNSGIRKGGIK